MYTIHKDMDRVTDNAETKLEKYPLKNKKAN